MNDKLISVGAGPIAHLAKYFLCKHEDLNSTSKTRIKEPGVEAHVSKPAVGRPRQADWGLLVSQPT